MPIRAYIGLAITGGAEIGHFAAPMDLTEPLQREKGAILRGSLDPTRVVQDGTPGTVCTKATRLPLAAAGVPAFVLSSGCKLPPGTSLENVEAFYRAVQSMTPV